LPEPYVDSQTVLNAVVQWASSGSLTREGIAPRVREAADAFRVLVIDRDSMSSDLLASALGRQKLFEVAAVQASDLMRILAASEVDLVVIGSDLKSACGDGFDLAQSVLRTRPEVSIVLLLRDSSHEMVVNAFRSGARGVFSRQQSIEEFLDCVAHVAKGFIWAGRSETTSLLQAIRNIPSVAFSSAGNAAALTSRELEVVQHAAKGMTNKAIAGSLCLSEHTVKNYLFRAFEKLGVSSRIELLFYLTIRGQMAEIKMPLGIED